MDDARTGGMGHRGIIADVRFKLVGSEIPVDHGYRLFAAVSEIVQEIHGDNGVGIHPISGRLVGDRRLAITERSYLTIRISSDRVRQLLPLAGKKLNIGGHEVRVGVPYVHGLIPNGQLYSRLVVIKGFMEPKSFLGGVLRQMQGLDIVGTPFLVEQQHIAEANKDMPSGSRSPVLRRTLRVRDKELVGFAVRVKGLTARDSIRLQEAGLGGRRRFGCGIFNPDKLGGE